MEVVEVVGLEERLYLAIFVLFCASVLVAIGLDDGAVTLTLAKQHEMFLTDRVKRLAVSMSHQQFASLCGDIHLDQSCLCIKDKDDAAGEQPQVEVYNVVECSVYFERVGVEAFD